MKRECRMSSEREGGILPPNISGFQSKADLLWVSRGLRRGRKTKSMDNRLKFLYYDITELWGHVRVEPEWKARCKRGRRGVGKSGLV